jgi:6-phospho-3-hexuloisomerase
MLGLHRLVRLMTSLNTRGQEAVAELGDVLKRLDAGQFEAFAETIAKAQKIVLHGLGREGLQMRGLAMRLFHLGLDAHVWGDMTTPFLGKGDLFLVSSGPGDFGSIRALTGVALAAGAKVAVVTAQPQSLTAREAGAVLHIPAQTMADDQGARQSVLPMGSLFESSMMLTFELLVLRLRELKDESAETMRARHTNME